MVAGVSDVARLGRRRWQSRTEVRAGALLGAVIVVLVVFQPDAVTSYGATLGRVQDTGLVALGLTPLLIVGEIDLSVGSTMGLAGVVGASVSTSAWLGIGCGLVVCAGVGCVNAFLVMKLRATSFIATLGTMIAVEGLALALSGNTPVTFRDTSLVLQSNRTLIGQITPGIALLLVVTLVAELTLSWAKPGRDLYAIGGNLRAAHAANIPVARRKFAAFVTCSLLAGGAGLLDMAVNASADPNVGSTALLTALAAAVIGGAYLEGGRGSGVGTTLASVAIGGVAVGLELHGINASMEEVVTGLILIVAIMSNPDALRRLRLNALRGVLVRQGGDGGSRLGATSETGIGGDPGGAGRATGGRDSP